MSHQELGLPGLVPPLPLTPACPCAGPQVGHWPAPPLWPLEEEAIEGWGSGWTFVKVPDLPQAERPHCVTGTSGVLGALAEMCLLSPAAATAGQSHPTPIRAGAAGHQPVPQSTRSSLSCPSAQRSCQEFAVTTQRRVARARAQTQPRCADLDARLLAFSPLSHTLPRRPQALEGAHRCTQVWPVSTAGLRIRITPRKGRAAGLHLCVSPGPACACVRVRVHMRVCWKCTGLEPGRPRNGTNSAICCPLLELPFQKAHAGPQMASSRRSPSPRPRVI